MFRTEREPENLYENASGSSASGTGVVAGAGGAAQWWWRACRRRALASQTLEFNERPGRVPRYESRGACQDAQPDAAGTMPRARARPACGTSMGVRLSSSCGTIDLPLELPSCMVVVQRWAPRPPPPSCSYHLLPESQRTHPHHQHRRLAGPGQGDHEPSCSADGEDDEEGGEEPRAEGESRTRTPTPEPPSPPSPLAHPADHNDESRGHQASSFGK